MTQKIKGRGGISARIITDSRHMETGDRITTYELEYPRFIHAEFMTHRIFSRNAASSRAIPIKKMIELISKRPAMPIFWGANQKGMQADEACNNPVRLYMDDLTPCDEPPQRAWDWAKEDALNAAAAFNKAGYHKQIINRLTEPFQFIKVICTATEFKNWFQLRRHPDAQPEIEEVAKCMWECQRTSIPDLLGKGSWHLPYVSTCDRGYYTEDKAGYYEFIDLSTALKVSASCCAQISYRNLNQSVQTAEKIYDKLVESWPPHLSPFEHQAMAPDPNTVDLQDDGITHMDKRGELWSGNFRGWIQNRQLLHSHINYNPL